MLAAYSAIVALTGLLVTLNIHSTVEQFLKDRHLGRLICFLVTLVLAGGMIVTISYMVITQAMDTADTIEVRVAQTSRSVSGR